VCPQPGEGCGGAGVANTLDRRCVPWPMHCMAENTPSLSPAHPHTPGEECRRGVPERSGSACAPGEAAVCASAVLEANMPDAYVSRARARRGVCVGSA